MEGISMIENSLTSLLASKGLSKLESTNQPFNPEHHLAIAMEESEEITEAVVVEEFQPGYRLHDRLLRTAKVKVAMPKPASANE
jgi:molecular chaperone GrpE